jgi:hypothetical protein
MSINSLLLKKIPEDILNNLIIPFTYNIQKKELIQDICSFYTDIRLLENMFYDYNEVIILNDLFRFCNNFISPMYDLEKRYENILRRHFLFKNKTKNELRLFVFYNLHRKILDNAGIKIRFLFGLLTPLERTRFFNHFYIND